MQVSAKRVDGANATISATIDSDLVAKTEEKIAKRYAQNVKIDGFRKGKVPVAVIKQRYADQLTNDVRTAIAEDALKVGLKELGEVELLGTPVVTKYEEKLVELAIPLRPTIDLGDYMAVVPTHKEIKITKKSVEDTIKKAAASTMPTEEIKTKRALKEGDIAFFDFDGFMDGKPLANGSAKSQELEIGSNSFIPGFEDQMVGMKAGESKTLELKFPDEYHARDIAGKDVKFEVTLHSIKTRKAVELNDELAKSLLPNIEDATLEKLYEVVEESMVNEEKAKLFEEELKPKLLDTLADKYNFDLPKTILDQEIDHLTNQEANKLSKEELEKLAKDQKEIEKLREAQRAEATKRVKITLLVDAIAKKEGISVSDQEAAQVVYYEAMRTGNNPKEMLEYYRNNNLLPVVKMSITEDKTLTALLDKKNKKEDKKPAAKAETAEKKPEAKAEGAEEKPAARKTKKAEEPEA